MTVIRSRELKAKEPAPADPQVVAELIQTHFPNLVGMSRAEVATSLKGFMSALKATKHIDDFVVMINPLMTAFDIAFKLYGGGSQFYLLQVAVK